MTKRASRARAVQTNRRRKRSGRRGLLLRGGLVALAIAVAAVAAIAFRSNDASGNASLPGAGLRAPDIVLPDFYTGESVRLAEFSGGPVVVNYWASWCIPCLAELPGFEQVHQRLGDEVAFLGVNIADDPGHAAVVAQQTGITYKLVADSTGETFAEFGAFAMPTTVFIDGGGTIVELYSGELTAAELEDKLVGHFLG